MGHDQICLLVHSYMKINTSQAAKILDHLDSTWLGHDQGHYKGNFYCDKNLKLSQGNRNAKRREAPE